MTIDAKTKLLDFGFFILFVLTLLGVTVIAFMGDGVDFRGYYAAAVVVQEGGNPYDYGQVAPVLAEVTGFQGNNPYYYPPWFSFLFIPLTWLPYSVARLIWLLFSAGLFWLTLNMSLTVIAWDLKGWRRWLLYFVAVLFFAAYCLRSEQAGFLLLFGLMLVLWSRPQKRPWLTAVGMVLLLLKPHVTLPVGIVLGLWLLLRPDKWPFLLTAVLFGLLLVSATLVIPDWYDLSQIELSQGITYETDGPGVLVGQRVNATAYDFVQNVFGGGTGVQYGFAVVVGLIGLFHLIFVWCRGGDITAVSLAALLLALLVTPYALQYDYVPLTLLLFWLLKQMPALGTIKKGLLLGLLGFALSVLLWQAWSYQGYWQVLAFTGAMIMVTWSLANPVNNLSPNQSGLASARCEWRH